MSRPVAICYAVAMTIVIACLCTAFFSTATLSPVQLLRAEAYPLTISDGDLTRAMPHHTRNVQPDDGGILLHSANWLSYRLEVPTTDPLPIFIVAKGTQADGRYASLTLHVNGDFKEEIFCTSREWGLYSTSLRLHPGMHRLDISFVNDYLFFPEDRDLSLRSLSIGQPPADAALFRRWTAPVEIPPYRLSRQVYAERERRSLRIWNGGRVAEDVIIERAGPHTVFLLAARSESHSKPARIDIAVNGTNAATCNVASGTHRLFSAHFTAAPGRHRIEIANRKRGRNGPDVLLTGLSVDHPITAVPPAEPPDIAGPRTVLPGGDWDYASTGNQRERAWVLWSNGCLRRKVTLQRPFAGNLAIEARGDLAGGIGPKMVVMVDKNQLACFNVDSETFRRYTLPLRLGAGTHRIVLIYNNDNTSQEGEDRNLYVGELIFIAEGTDSREE